MLLHSVLRNRPLSVQKTSFLGDKQVACPDKAGEAVTGRVRRPQGDIGNLAAISRLWVAGCLVFVRFLFWRPQRAAFLHLVRLHGWDSQIFHHSVSTCFKQFCRGTSLESVDPWAFMVRTFWRPGNWNLQKLDLEFFGRKSIDFYML